MPKSYVDNLNVAVIQVAVRLPNFQAECREFESRLPLQTETKLKKSLQKCRGFSLNCSNSPK